MPRLSHLVVFMLAIFAFVPGAPAQTLTVKSSDGELPDGAIIRLLAGGGGAAAAGNPQEAAEPARPEVYELTVGSDGAVELPALEPGRVSVQVRMRDGEIFGAFLMPAEALAGAALVVPGAAPRQTRPGAKGPGSTVKAGPYTLGGTVYGGSQQLENAAVTLFDAATNAQLDTTFTNASGFYTFSVADGTYDLLISPPGASGFDDAVVEDVVISGGDVTQNVVLIPEGVIIEGIVTMPDGTPVDNAYVDLELFSTNFFDNTNTNEFGEFQFVVENSTDEYFMTVKGAGDHINIPELDDYWEVRFVVTDIFPTTNLSFDIELPLYRIYGQVTDEYTSPVENATLRLGNSNYINSSNPSVLISYYQEPNVSTDANGDYSVYLLSGDGFYCSLLALPPQGTTLGLQAFEDFSVTTDTELNIVLVEGNRVYGQVLLNDGAPYPQIDVEFGHNNNGTFEFWSASRTDNSGNYEFYTDEQTYDVRIVSRFGSSEGHL